MARKKALTETTTTRITHSLQLGDVLDLIASKGLLGSNRPQVAHALIVEAIGRMQTEGRLPADYQAGETLEGAIAALKKKSK
jgi:hypothetical protein